MKAIFLHPIRFKRAAPASYRPPVVGDAWTVYGYTDWSVNLSLEAKPICQTQLKAYVVHISYVPRFTCTKSFDSVFNTEKKSMSVAAVEWAQAGNLQSNGMRLRALAGELPKTNA